MQGSTPHRITIGRFFVCFGTLVPEWRGLMLVPFAEMSLQLFGAVALPAFSTSAPRLLIADEAAKQLFFRYLE